MANVKLGRNDPCPCGSGKKYKRCHGMLEVHPALRPQRQQPQATTHSTLGQQEIGALMSLFDQQRYSEAELLARSMTTRFPHYGFIWKVLGVALKQMGRNADALVSMQKAVALTPTDPDASNILGVILYDMKRLDEAEASYRRALKAKPDHVEAHSNLGNILKDTGRLAEAELNYRRALQMRPDYAVAHYNLGIVLKDLGRLGEAEASYRRALQITPNDAEVLNNLGITLQGMNRLDEAEASYRRALQIKPNDAEVHRNLGITLKDMGRLDEALDSYRLSLKGKDWKAALRRLTTPLVLTTGLVLDSQCATGFAETGKQPVGMDKQTISPPAPTAPASALHEAVQSETANAKKLRIVLIYPPPWQIPSPGEPVPGMPFGPPRDSNDCNLDDGDFQTITYGLLTIAAQAKRAGHEVSIYNLAVRPWREVVALIAKTEADVYGISAFTANRRGMGAVATLVRQHHPQAHITVGGPFVTALPQETLKYYRDIDTAVIGEGEETFMELLERVGSGMPTTGIPGTAWRHGEEVAYGPTRARIKDLNALASPFDYFTSSIVMTSRGCPSKCTFCGSFATWGKLLRFHSAESCLDIFRKALGRLPVPFMAIKDDTFTAHRRRTIAICDAIIENKMNFLWSCDTRVDSLDDELLYKMRLAGCQTVSFGVESGSLEILKAIRKETTPEMVLEATRSARKYGMHVRYYMILCIRGETPETLQQSNDLIKAGRPNRYYSGALSFFPGTEDWAILREKQGLTPDIFFTNDFRELNIATNRQQDFQDIFVHAACDIGAINGFDYTVEEREAVAERLPHLHSVHVELANAYLHAGKFDEAELALNRAEELGFPIANIIQNQRACIAYARNDPASALALLKHASQCYPHHIVMKNLKNLQDWSDSPVNKRGRPTVLNGSVQAIDFNSQL
jgi:radical SAM superfamily enzyme YgiQ (UPF0313 family)/Flp pilus assembly protein TadD